MADERDIAIGVMILASRNPNGRCSFKQAYRDIPAVVKLSAANAAPSHIRRGEMMWQQLVRNIKSHDTADGNFIANGYLKHLSRYGYEITPAGKLYLEHNGLE